MNVFPQSKHLGIITFTVDANCIYIVLVSLIHDCLMFSKGKNRTGNCGELEKMAHKKKMTHKHKKLYRNTQGRYIKVGAKKHTH